MTEANATKISVMLVEDDTIFRESLQEMINQNEALSCQFTWERAEECIEHIAKKDIPEILLMDIDLPGISGIEAIKPILRHSPNTRIVMLTIFDDDDKVFNAICEGAVGYLLKSSAMKDIHRNILEVVRGGAAMNPHIAAKVLTMFTRYAQPKSDYGLTTRETEILHHLVNGLSKKHIASQLNISFYTVDTHLKNIYSKLQVHSQVDVVAKAIKERLI